MKAATPAGTWPVGGENRKGFFSGRALTGACVAMSLLAACGGSSGPDATEGATVAQSPVADNPAAGQRAAGESPTAAPTSPDATKQAVKKPAPTAPTAPTPVATVNSIDTIIDDMRLMNDLELAGVPGDYGWAKGPGHVIMGNDPRGTNTPSWWTVDNGRFKGDAYWNAILPWFVVFDGVGNGASNTRVQLRNMKLYMKRKSSGAWHLLEASAGVRGNLYSKSLQDMDVASPDIRSEADGSTSILPPGGNLVFHGWSSGFSEIEGSDVGAIFLTLQARLVKDDETGTDDRAAARYLVHVGGDYYPDTSTRASDLAPAYYLPGIGLSRAKLVANDWQAFNFSTVDVGVDDPGGATLTEAELRAAPPPLE